MVYIGIDLGTTYSCVAIIENEVCKIIFDGEGNNFLPSIVSFGDEEILVGNPALNYHDLSSVLYDSKRLLGWKFMNNFPIAENRLLWTFDLDTRNNKVGYVLNKGTPNERFVTPEEVSAEILKKIKTIAESYIGSQVTGAVVTIPANFQDNQIAATKKAIELAGLKLKLMIDEPTAAAIAYNAERKLSDSMIMIFDFGGGTLDISICEIKNGKIMIKAVKGDKHLGGQDFDSIIMNYAYTEYMRLSNTDIFANNRLVKRLRNECKRVKEALSFTASTVNIHLDIDKGPELSVNLSQKKFNELCDDLFTRSINLIDQALKMARLHENNISHVILVGGSTRIPAVKELLERKFGRDKLKRNINPDEAIVFGAANLADAIEKKKQIPLINNIMNELARNVNNLQLGGNNSSNNLHKILFYVFYRNNDKKEGRICLFNPQICSVDEIAKFDNWYWPYEISTTKDKILGMNDRAESFEIYDLDTQQFSRGSDPPEWRDGASVAYFKDKLYYLGGKDPKTEKNTNRIDVLIDEQWETGLAFPHPIYFVQAITWNEILYVIDGYTNKKIYQLSNDEREWIEIGEIPERRDSFRVSSLNGRIYITGGLKSDNNDIVYRSLKSCWCFDPSAPVKRRMYRIADMNYARWEHSLIVNNGKLYVIGGMTYSKDKEVLCSKIEEYNPLIDEWEIVGEDTTEPVRQLSMVDARIQPDYPLQPTKIRNTEDEKPDDRSKVYSLDYDKDALLGRGSHGTVVYKGKFGKRVVAVKIVPPTLKDAYHMVKREETNLGISDRHPNIIRYFYKKEDHLQYSYLALELCEGSLEDYVAKEVFRERMKIGDVEILKQTTEGLKYLHSKGIAHRDLKPHNILIAEDNNEHRVVLADFGISKYIKPDINATASAFTFDQIGTIGWSAPEAIVQFEETVVPSAEAAVSPERENFPLDIFSLGCLYYYVLTKGSHPFGDKNPYTRVVNIDKGDYNLDNMNKLPDADTAKPLIEKMISHLPKDRPTIDEIHKHPFFWDTKKRIDFIHACHDRLPPLNNTNTDPLIIDLEKNKSTVIKNDWWNELSVPLQNDLNSRRNKKGILLYDTASVRDLLRTIRNKEQHSNEWSNDLKKEFVGPDAPKFWDYFASRFPQLFMHVYETMKQCAKEKEFSKYY